MTSFLPYALGSIQLVASEKGLQSVDFLSDHTTQPQGDSVAGNTQAAWHLAQARSQLIEYFAGNLQKFKLSLDLEGTDFQKLVWSGLQTIPYGQTISYKQLAERVAKPTASRAVGNANGKNPIPIIIPCHRVVAADGSLGGYSSGLKIKSWLLQLES